MRWGKILLIFQAVVTLIIGIAFFSQLTVIGASEISDLKIELMSGEKSTEDPSSAINNIRTRFTVASYTLFVIGLVELIIIIRLFS
jgi:hypothetical protein